MSALDPEKRLPKVDEAWTRADGVYVVLATDRQAHRVAMSKPDSSWIVYDLDYFWSLGFSPPAPPRPPLPEPTVKWGVIRTDAILGLSAVYPTRKKAKRHIEAARDPSLLVKATTTYEYVEDPS